MTDDRRPIEDYLPIQAISAEASREKSVRNGHISTLHLGWARRPLAACRAALDARRPEFLPAVKRFLHNRFEVKGLSFSPFSVMLDVGSRGVGPAQVRELPVL